METILTAVVLIIALCELVRLRKEDNKSQKELRHMASDFFEARFELSEVKKSNSANKGWNTKYVKTIEVQEDLIEEQAKTIEKMKDLDFTSGEFINYQSTLLDDKATEIINSNTKIDESKVVCEALLKLAKKGNMEEAKAIVKEYYKM